ncbi:phage tail tape measure protein [Candidatus Symbiopectobacterium sp. NZEC151]|nr:phage tail tape measure protein [Candidatus Symbiopectobacterium sp. NZEC151]
MLSMLANVALRASMVEGVNAILGFFDISTTTKDKDKDKDQGKNKQSTSSNPATTVAQRNDTQKSNNNQEGGESNNHIGKTWVDGLSESWGKYSESALDSYSIIQAGGDAAFQQLDNSVMNFVRTGKLNFSSFAESVLGMLAEIAVKSALVQGVNALMGAFGVTANAKGGVYTSSSLSAYSGQVVDRPTLFAFAKGAGLMGEAGPEAIMPLTRNANGVLGVRAVGGVSGNTAPQVSINIASDGRISQTSSAGLAQFGSEIGSFVDQRFKSLLTREMGQGRMLSTAMKGRRS